MRADDQENPPTLTRRSPRCPRPHRPARSRTRRATHQPGRVRRVGSGPPRARPAPDRPERASQGLKAVRDRARGSREGGSRIRRASARARSVADSDAGLRSVARPTVVMFQDGARWRCERTAAGTVTAGRSSAVTMPNMPVAALGVRQDVAVERPRAGVVAVDDDVPALARVDAQRVARERGADPSG